MLRLNEGPILFVSFTGTAVVPGHNKLASFEEPLTMAQSQGGMTFNDASGNAYTG